MKKIILISLIVLFLATPVVANTSSEYTLKHDLTITLDGEWNLGVIVTTPAQGGMDLNLDGIGKAFIESKLMIASVETVSSNWWELF